MTLPDWTWSTMIKVVRTVILWPNSRPPSIHTWECGPFLEWWRSAMFKFDHLFLQTSGERLEWQNPPQISRYCSVISHCSPLHGSKADYIWMPWYISENVLTPASKLFQNPLICHTVDAGVREKGHRRIEAIAKTCKKGLDVVSVPFWSCPIRGGRSRRYGNTRISYNVLMDLSRFWSTSNEG